MSTWDRDLRHEQARAARQRSDSADRRARILANAAQTLGSRTAVAVHLGISPAAVTKSLHQAGRGGPPMADYLEISLPHAGDAVPLPDEWEAMSPDQQTVAATRAAAAWKAIAILTSALGRQCHQASEALAGATLDSGDDESAETMPDWLDVSGLDAATFDILTGILSDTAAALMDHTRAAWSRADGWGVAADGHMGEAGAY